MRHLYVEGSNIDIYYPNAICFSREKNTYILVVTNKTEVNEDVSVTMEYGGQRVGITRKTNAQGKVIFPISSILESFAAASDVTVLEIVDCTVSYGSVIPLNPITVIVGSSNMELVPLSEQETPNNKPAARKIVIYPSFGIRQSVFVPALRGSNITLFAADNKTVIAMVSPSDYPAIEFEPRKVDFTSDHMIVTASYKDTLKSFDVPFDVDICTEGLLLRWTDKHGIQYCYRWSVETTTQEISSNNSYTVLDELLQPIDRQINTLLTTYTLHSRKVEQTIYDLCKSILSGHDIQMYDVQSGQWSRCYVNEGSADDDGSVLKDLVIEATLSEYNL